MDAGTQTGKNALQAMPAYNTHGRCGHVIRPGRRARNRLDEATLNRLTLERHQLWLYLLAVLAGMIAGQQLTVPAAYFERWLWPVLAALLLAVFTQIPLLRLRAAFADRRFAAATLAGNFLVLPLLAWALVQWLPDDPALRTGVLLVLLVPCTDWCIAFTQMGRGDAARATAVTPLNLILQLALLPLYLGVMSDAPLSQLLTPAAAWPLLLVVLGPLVVALALAHAIRRASWRTRVVDHLAWWPAPLLALAVFLVAASQATAIREAWLLVPRVVPVFALFVILAACLARVLAGRLALPVAQGRALAFGFATRNSFLVLPVALAMPAGWEVAALVVVMQSLVELAAMAVFIWWVPQRLFPDPPGQSAPLR